MNFVINLVFIAVFFYIYVCPIIIHYVTYFLTVNYIEKEGQRRTTLRDFNGKGPEKQMVGNRNRRPNQRTF